MWPGEPDGIELPGPSLSPLSGTGYGRVDAARDREAVTGALLPSGVYRAVAAASVFPVQRGVAVWHVV